MTAITEAYAKKKTCPFTLNSGQSWGFCQASDCMAWRWQSALTVDNPSRIPGEGQKITTHLGYCGLAGKP
jgi:hypothetical protein